MSSWYFVKRKRRSDIGQKHKPRSDKSRGAWVTRPSKGGVEFYWDPDAQGDGKTVHCPGCDKQLVVNPWWKG